MIKVVNIYKSFKDRLILNNINFEVNKGETLVIIGGSGSGKSTLLKLLIGLLRPEQGQIFIKFSDPHGAQFDLAQGLLAGNV